MPIALITGASSGIGQATAHLLADKGIDLIVCGRRQERLDELKNTLGKKVKILSLLFDVRDKKAVFEQISQIPAEWQAIDYLINNAGNAHGLASFADADLDDWDMMLDTNVKGLLYVSKAVLPMMLARKKGHIVNLGSIAGKEVYPNGSVYCASKFSVDALSTAMRMDLLGNGIKVSAIHPGMVETEFSIVRFKGDEARAKSVYQGVEPLRGADIADIIWYIISAPAHVNIADLVVFPSAQASATQVKRN